nr:hypothetical protein [Streptomyces sp. CB02959]
MDQQQEDALVGADPVQLGAEGNVGGEVEGVACGRVQCVGEFDLGDLPGLPVEGELGCPQDQLVRITVHVGEHGAQRFMTFHHIAQRRPQGLRVDVALQPQRQRHVVRGRRAFQLVQKPQSTLGEGQRDHDLIPSSSCLIGHD